MQTLYDLIREESNLVNKKEILDDLIVSKLYTEEESRDESKKQEAREEVTRLREKKSTVENQLTNVRSALKNRLFTLLQQ